MPSITEEQAQFLLHISLDTMQREQASTQRVIDAIPSDKGTYSPDSISMSALDLGWHIAIVEKAFSDAVINGEFAASLMTRPDTIKTPADLSAWYREMVAHQASHLARLSGEQLSKVIDFSGMFQLPAVMYLSFIVNHSAHHRGQLTMYLRPMGAKVPAIYGESYDSALEKSA